MLKDQINKDYLESYKAHEEIKTSVLRLVKSAIQNAEIAKKEALTDDEIVALLKREVKQREESAEVYIKGNNLETAEKERAEAALIGQYLPKQLSETETREIVQKVLKDNAITDKSKMGQAIGLIMKEYGNQIDGKMVASIVSQELN